MVTERQKYLTEQLDIASNNYYKHGFSSYSDTEFDLLFKELQQLEKESGETLLNSPTRRVGSDAQTEFKKVKHDRCMLTIENTYDDNGLIEWIKKIRAEYPKASFITSTKYDGVSCELKYEKGYLVAASTRGDKIEGDDITDNVRTIKDIPMFIPQIADMSLTVYGEILLPKSKLSSINEERLSMGLKPFSNTRNACTGSIKQLDSRITASRGLIFRQWDCFSTTNPDINNDTMDRKMEFLRGIGFPTDTGSSYYLIESKTTPEQASGIITHHKRELDLLHVDYDYDGVVLKINEGDIQNRYGIADHRAIEWAIARKWNEERITTTKLIDVDFQVGRTGVLTPVGRLEPVELDGVTISNITLNNMDFINDNGIEINSILKITRSGGVIPYVLGVQELMENHKPISIPECCPICGGVIKKKESSNGKEGVQYFCDNNDCPAQVKGKLIEFCSKDCMNIKSIGESVIDDLYKIGVRSFMDLYRLEDLGKDALIFRLGEGYKDKSVTKMLENISESKKQPFSKLLASISIPGVGKVGGRLLASNFDNIDELASASVERLSGIYGIGEVMAKDIHDYFVENKNVVEFFKNNGFNIGKDKNESADDANVSDNQVLKGISVCFTGASEYFKGDEVEDFLARNGAECKSGVSKKLDYLITGNAPGGSKVKKAQELGVVIMTEKEFYEKYKINP